MLRFSLQTHCLLVYARMDIESPLDKTPWSDNIDLENSLLTVDAPSSASSDSIEFLSLDMFSSLFEAVFDHAECELNQAAKEDLPSVVEI